MFCSNCGKELDNNVKFCPECGYDLQSNKSIVLKINNGNIDKKKIRIILIYSGIIAFFLIIGLCIYNILSPINYDFGFASIKASYNPFWGRVKGNVSFLGISKDIERNDVSPFEYIKLKQNLKGADKNEIDSTLTSYVNMDIQDSTLNNESHKTFSPKFKSNTLQQAYESDFKKKNPNMVLNSQEISDDMNHYINGGGSLYGVAMKALEDSTNSESPYKNLNLKYINLFLKKYDCLFKRFDISYCGMEKIVIYDDEYVYLTETVKSLVNALNTLFN